MKRQRPKKAGPSTGNSLVSRSGLAPYKELFPDAADLHDTYAEWLKDAEASVKRLTLPGATVEPVIVDTHAEVRREFRRGVIGHCAH